MTLSKREEIAMLRNFAKKLGGPNNSYTGAWLTAELHNLERAIMNDHPAACEAKTYAEAETIRTQIIEEATHRANAIRAEADAYAARLKKQSDDNAALDMRRLEVIRGANRDAADLVQQIQTIYHRAIRA